MDKDKQMTIGQIAKRMGISVRTIQYYEQQGLLEPAARTEGGRRVYQHEDLIRLHLILSMKALGFSLADIRSRLMRMTTLEEMRSALDEQIEAVDAKIACWQQTRDVLRVLREEMEHMERLDIQRCADIVYNAQIGNDGLWMMRHFDDDLLEMCRSRFDRDSAEGFVRRMQDAAATLEDAQQRGWTPEDPRTMRAAEVYWDLVLEFTEGDANLIQRMMESASSDALAVGGASAEFVGRALHAYLSGTAAGAAQREEKS